MRYLYSFVYYCLLPIIFLRLLWRSIKAPDYRRRIGERFGFFRPFDFNLDANDTQNNKAQEEREEANHNLKSQQKIKAQHKPILIHAVSVGESIAALPLIRQLQKKYPRTPLVITTTTPTGSAQIKKSLAQSIAAKKVAHVYLPYDLPGAISRFLKKVDPQLLIIMETELWPNLLAACQAKNISSALINARLSARSARGYANFKILIQGMLANLDLIVAQTRADGKRFLSLGLAREKLKVTGSIKFDLELSDKVRHQAKVLKERWKEKNSRAILIAASTHQGEDEIILKAFALLIQKLTSSHSAIAESLSDAAKQRLLTTPLLVIVPRHPERFLSVEKLAAKNFKTARFSADNLQPDTEVLIGDVMGQLLSFYGASDIAFVGGSLINHGGHNFLEPAAWQVPIISGQHVFNFQAIADELLACNGLCLAENAQNLSDLWYGLLSDESLFERIGIAAKEYQQDKQGALDKVLSLLSKFIN